MIDGKKDKTIELASIIQRASSSLDTSSLAIPVASSPTKPDQEKEASPPFQRAHLLTMIRNMVTKPEGTK